MIRNYRKAVDKEDIEDFKLPFLSYMLELTTGGVL